MFYVLRRDGMLFKGLAHLGLVVKLGHVHGGLAVLVTQCAGGAVLDQHLHALLLSIARLV